MASIIDWVQNYWFELSSLLLQLATLVTVIWFGRKGLAIFAGSPRATEAGRSEAAEPRPARPSGEFHGGLRGLIPIEAVGQQANQATAHVAQAMMAGVGLGRAILRWLNTPWAGGSSTPWRRVSRPVS
jgi:hypothetical protein